MDYPNVAPEFHNFTCPVCELGTLHSLGGDSAKCDECGCLIGGAILTTLNGIHALPEPLGNHACECGHPEMRRLPDGVFRCPSCGSEVLPVKYSGDVWERGHSEAYWCGWMDGRFHDARDFAHNARLSKWESATDRLDYYRGHRAGHEARSGKKRRSLKAS